jgi:hypothetical protein
MIIVDTRSLTPSPCITKSLGRMWLSAVELWKSPWPMFVSIDHQDQKPSLVSQRQEPQTNIPD